MLNLLFAGLAWVLGLFGFGKADERDKERSAGEQYGRTAENLAGAEQALEDVAKAQAARDRASGDLGGVRDDPNNAGPG